MREQSIYIFYAYQSRQWLDQTFASLGTWILKVIKISSTDITILFHSFIFRSWSVSWWIQSLSQITLGTSWECTWIFTLSYLGAVESSRSTSRVEGKWRTSEETHMGWGRTCETPSRQVLRNKPETSVLHRVMLFKILLDQWFSIFYMVIFSHGQEEIDSSSTKSRASFT